jgi:hypothetical protein
MPKNSKISTEETIDVTASTVESLKNSKVEESFEEVEMQEEDEEQTSTKVIKGTKVLKEKEPIPEVAEENVAENKSEFESYDSISKEKKEVMSQIKKLYSRLAYLEKESDKEHAKTAKEAKKKNKRTNSDPNKKPAGFETPSLIPEKFFKFVTCGLKKKKFSEEKTKELEDKDLKADSMIPRSFVTRIVYDYIKHCNLYKETENDNKRYINPDAFIKELFTMEDTEEIGFFNFQTYVCRLFPKKDKKAKNLEDNENNDEEEEEEAVQEEVEEVEEAIQEEEELEPVKTKNKVKSKTSVSNI